MLSSTPLRLLALKFQDHPLEEWFAEQSPPGKVELTVVDLTEGEVSPLPKDLSGFDGIIGTGSKHMATGLEKTPWMGEVASFLQGAHQQQIPMFLWCFAYQLFSRSLGGEVEKLRPRREIGVRPMQVTEEGRGHPLLDGLADTFQMPESHEEWVSRLPEGARVLVSNECGPQLVHFGGNTYGAQFHAEIHHLEIMRWLIETRCIGPLWPAAEVQALLDGLAFTSHGRTFLANLVALFAGLREARLPPAASEVIAPRRASRRSPEGIRTRTTA